MSYRGFYPTLFCNHGFNVLKLHLTHFQITMCKSGCQPSSGHPDLVWCYKLCQIHNGHPGRGDRRPICRCDPGERGSGTSSTEAGDREGHVSSSLTCFSAPINAQREKKMCSFALLCLFFIYLFSCFNIPKWFSLWGMVWARFMLKI